MSSKVQRSVEIIRNKIGTLDPKFAIILGSGLGALTSSIIDPVRISFSELPDFPESAVSGHKGELVAGTIEGVPLIMLSGRVHYYEHGDAGAMRPIIDTFHQLGIENLILTNSAGSVREDMPPGSVMQITDHINFSGSNPLFGEETDGRFVGLSNAYDLDIMTRMRKAAQKSNVQLHQGVYMWFSGPSFETPAEIKMARIFGADAVGMSTVPEVILARFFGMNASAASIITNFAAGMTGDELSHQETKDMAPIGGANLAKILKTMFADL